MIILDFIHTINITQKTNILDTQWELNSLQYWLANWMFFETFDSISHLFEWNCKNKSIWIILISSKKKNILEWSRQKKLIEFLIERIKKEEIAM